MTFYFNEVLPFLGKMLQGLLISVSVTLVGMLVGSLIGFLLYLGRTGPLRMLRYLCGAYIEVIRNTPLLVQLYLLYFGLPAIGVEIDPLTATLIGLSLNSAAYLAEIFRAGMGSIPVGQGEAASALGLSRPQSFLFVKFRPAFKNMLPAVTNQLILVFLFSSVASFISLDDLMNTILDTGSQTARKFETLIIGGILYYAVSALFTVASKGIERRAFRW